MGEKAIKKVAKKMIMRKVLSCLVIIAILVSAVPVSIFAMDDSNNSTGNTSNYSNETLLEKSFTENNSAEMMIPLFNNWREDDNISGDCAPMPDADMPEIYLNDTQESAASLDPGNDTVATILSDASNNTRKNVSALGCNVYVKIDDDTCVGYKVYVDGVYKLTEGEGGTPDGYCAFYVSAGTHTIEIRKNGCSASITKNFQCGHTYRWVSMPDYWCECGDQEENREMKFRGTAQGDPFGCYSGGTCQDVSVTELISGGEIPDYVVVALLNRAPKGYFDSSIQHGDKVEVYGKYSGSGCDISLNGEDYYIKKVEPSETLSINVWTDKSEYKIGETVTIYYQTNKKCTAKLTITKPDGSKVQYGPNEIPACTRYKSATAGYPVGKRTVVFEAWAGDEYKKATCYFNVVEEEKRNVKIKGKVTNILYPISFPPIYIIAIDEVIEDPLNKFHEGDDVSVSYPWDTSAEIDSGIAIGDNVEVYGAYYEDGYAITLIKSEHYLKKIEEKKPDLIIQDITWSPSNPKEGDDVEFTITVKNQGKGRADESWLGFRFFPPKGIPVGSEVRLKCPSLDSGETASLYDTITLSTCGKYTFKATADARKDIKESREDNNEKTAIINIECPAKKPDLIIQDIIWKPENPKQGDNVEFTITVKNQGSESAGTSTVKYYIDGSYVTSDSVPGLSAGSTSTQTFTWTANKCGDVQVKAIADATNVVTESNEGNNQRVETINIKCLPKEKPDLIIKDISWEPEQPNEGEKITFHITIKNKGEETAYPASYSFYVDNSFKGGGSVSRLSAGDTYLFTLTLTMKKCGTIQLKAVADPDNQIDESDEKNNELTKTIIINKIDWDGIIKRTKAQRKIYTANKNYIFNEHWWFSLIEMSAEEVDEEMQNMISPFSEAGAALFTVAGLPGDVYSLAKTSITVTNMVMNCIGIHYYSVIEDALRENKKDYRPCFDKLIDACDKVIIAAESHKASDLHSALLHEKDVIELAYIQAKSYDDRIKGSMSFYSLWEVPYTAMKNQIACFRHHLEERYCYITLLLDKDSKKLNVEKGPAWTLSDTKLPPPPDEFFWISKTKLDLLGALSDPEDSDVRHTYLTKGSKIAINLWEGYYPNTDGPYTFKFYVKYGSAPTEYSYGWKGEKYGVINIDKTGTYYFMVRGNGYGEYRLKVKEYPWYYPVGKPLDKELLVFSCPVHVTITDKSGRVITDTGINEIPNANIIVKGEEKIFYLPLDCTYSTEINAYDSGTFNFTRVSPIGNDISITKFENIPVTASTKASVEIEPGVTDYTMSIDYNGDGVTDEEKSPDVSETIVNVGPENDYAKDSYINVVSGTIAGQDINPNNPEITVSSAKKISGSFDISVRNTGHSGSIFPIVATPNWGPHESSYWSITGDQAPGIKTHTVNVDLNAPSKPGVYYIIVAGQWELSAANVASGTNWVVGENQWNDGNDLADWSTSMIEQAIKSGLVIADWEKVEGMVKMYVPATAIRVKVVTEKPKAWLHSGYDLNNTRLYSYPSKTSVSNFDISWTSTNEGKILTGDINGDGELELVSAFEGRVCAMDKNGVLLWSNSVATDSGISGAKVNSMDLADMDGDNIPEVVVGISSAVPYPEVNKPLRILFYDGAGNLLKNISTPNSHVIDVKCVDLNNDGRKEVIATIQAWYTLKPRGIYVYDYNTGNERWHYNIGPQLWIDAIADINNDGNKEIVVGTFAPHNGNSDHGTDDFHSYVFVLDKDGNNLWTKQIGWDSVYSSVADLNNDGNPEIISFRNQNEPYYPGPNDVYILNPANGNIVDTYNGPANKGWKGWAIADINGDGKKEIVIGNRDGTLRVLDYNLNLIDSCGLSGTVQAINDVNGDGKLEIIVCTDDKRLVVLDNELNEIWSYKLGAKGNAIVSDLIPGGTNEIIVSADKLCIFSGIEGSVPGDVTGDGRVDYKDLTGIIEHWGAIDTKYDVDRSGTVGYSDVKFILDHWTASKPYGRATTTVKGPVTVPLGSSFKVLIKTDGTVEAAHISVIFPSELKIESINVDPDVDFDFSTYQNGTDWIDVIAAEAPGLPTGYPEAPLLAEICFTATEEGTYTIDISSVLNGEANDVEALTVGVVKAGGIDAIPPDITIISPEEGVTYATNEIALEVTANEAISKWSYNLNRAGNVTFTPNITIIAREGANSLVVFAEDMVGNICCSEVSFEVDTTV